MCRPGQLVTRTQIQQQHLYTFNMHTCHVHSSGLWPFSESCSDHDHDRGAWIRSLYTCGPGSGLHMMDYICDARAQNMFSALNTGHQLATGHGLPGKENKSGTAIPTSFGIGLMRIWMPQHPGISDRSHTHSQSAGHTHGHTHGCRCLCMRVRM